jgi:2-(1,2-epoxy-1,2-dihydrophenyl)acetyl-CoA isomerase
VKSFHNVLQTLADSPALVVTLVNGVAAGGGLSLALAGDIRFGLQEATFRAGYGRVGLTVDGGLSWRLPRLVGMAQALGMLHRIVAPSELAKSFDELVGRTKLQARSLFLKHRQMLLESQARTLSQALEAEALAMKVASAQADGQEGVTAFVEKRPPKFTT